MIIAFQSTRPRGARPSKGLADKRILVVSIHAPAWGATQYNPNSLGCQEGFNPRARVGRDVKMDTGLPKLRQFQSTRPRGARHSSNESLIVYRWFQSTRPRGARRANGWYGTAHPFRFNPRARVGRDATKKIPKAGDDEFQSTRPRGARLTVDDMRYTYLWGFNPRARVGRDSSYHADR